MTVVYKKKVNSKYHVYIGEYFVIGVDIEQYDSSLPEKYLRGLLQDISDSDAPEAFKSYLAIVPSAPVAFDAFARLVSSFYYPIESLNSIKQFQYYLGLILSKASCIDSIDAWHLTLWDKNI